tara:strand:- start:5666 stop:6613 length:948 start_codon:yes stop_codon:yes gene_type:complete
MAFATIAAGAGAIKTLSNLAGARNQAQGMLDAGRDSLLTARYNINQRKKEAQYNQFQSLEQGHRVASQIQTGAMQAEGSAKASAGASGAVVDGGTPQAVLTNIAQEGLNAQRDAILNTKNQMKAIRRDTENQNKTEWNQANAYAEGLKRDAKRTIDNSRLQAVADIAQTAASVYSAGTAGGTKAFTWGLEGAKVASEVKGMSDAQKRHTSNYSKLTKGKGSNKGFTDMSKVKPRGEIQGYSMDKRRRTGGAESSRTSDRLWHQMKTRSFDFSKAGFKRMFGFGEGRVNYGAGGKAYNFLRGRGVRGRAASKTYKY